MPADPILITVPEAELEWSYVRSSGPGGQNVNKVASKAVLRWHVTASQVLPPEIKSRFLSQQHRRITVEGEMVLNSQRFRDQERNRQDCLDKLHEMIRQATLVPKARKATRPTRSSKRVRLENKRRRSGIKATRQRPSED